MTTPHDDARSPVERALGVVTRVEAGEGGTALLLTLNVFLLLTAYYVIKPVREGLILATPGGAEIKSYMGAAIAASLLVLVPLYGAVADRIRKARLVVGVTLFFASHLVLFYLAGSGAFALPATTEAAAAAREGALFKLAIVFFAWVGVFNMMLVAQFWAFANDLYAPAQGKRLFALVGIGASAGGVVGSWLTTKLVPRGVPKAEAGPLTMRLLLVAAVILCVSAALTALTARREAGSTRARPEAERSPTPNASSEPRDAGTFLLVARHRYLRLIAAFSVLFTFVNTNGEYVLSATVKAAANAAAQAGGDTGAFATSFYGSFFLAVNIGVMVLQTFFVSRIVDRIGLRGGFFILPAIALLDAVGVALAPTLAVVRVAKIAENATDYSLNNTLRNILWLPTTTEMKYKAKQAVDTFFVRLGDVASAGLVWLGARQLGWSVRGFALVNVALVALWLVVARGIVSENERMSSNK